MGSLSEEDAIVTALGGRAVALQSLGTSIGDFGFNFCCWFLREESVETKNAFTIATTRVSPKPMSSEGTNNQWRLLPIPTVQLSHMPTLYSDLRTSGLLLCHPLITIRTSLGLAMLRLTSASYLVDRTWEVAQLYVCMKP